jgi:hypothetical protein
MSTTTFRLEVYADRGFRTDSIALAHMELRHPIDEELRRWLKAHVPNHKQMSLAVGHSESWLHKYVNGAGHATIDDLVRLAGMLLGLNLPFLSVPEHRLLKAFADLEEDDRVDVLEYTDHRAKLARQVRSKESSEPEARTPQARVRRARGTR